MINFVNTGEYKYFSEDSKTSYLWTFIGKEIFVELLNIAYSRVIFSFTPSATS